MSSLLLAERADYLVHDSYTVETEDHEDHTFNGVMFDVATLRTRPVDAVVVDAIYVRGGLGAMTVWSTPDGRAGKEQSQEHWSCCFQQKVASSFHDFKRLQLDPPLVLRPDRTYGLYVHSAEQGDDGVVYDNERDAICHEDDYIRVLPGLAHLSPEPFSGEGPWWGSPWRRRRAFVGKISYGARFVLWRPPMHGAFNPQFRRGCAAAFFALTMGWGGLPTDCVLYILHLARFDWFDLPETRALGAAASSDEDDEDVPEEVLAARHVARQARYTSDYSRFDNIDDSSDGDDEDYGL
mmetsp:Transcript_16642/g.51829  ORF Transcript_16642/g.51829 Transcript_16642/m.51829 type:complete len:295 (+) Transcript_16642:237-1121(+)